MRAALMERGSIRVEEVPDPMPEQGEVLVRTLACGICGSDLHAARHTDEFVRTSLEAGGAFKLTTFDPVVLGHEFCAEVVDYGPRTDALLALGQLVCSVPMLRRSEPVPVGYSPDAPGGFGEYMVLSADLVKSVPAGTPARLAALTEPMAVGLHAVNRAGVQQGDICVVVGAGPVGLAVLANLRAAGIDGVIVSEFSPKRRQLAAELGADQTIDPRQRSPYEAPEFKNAGRTVVFDCVGVPGVIDQIFLGARRHTTVVVVGVCLEVDHARPLIAVNKELTVHYVLGYSLDEFDRTLALISEGVLDVEPIITHEVALDGVADAFDALAAPDAHGKVMVCP